MNRLPELTPQEELDRKPPTPGIFILVTAICSCLTFAAVIKAEVWVTEYNAERLR